uniref:NAD(P)(+)--arginine ADP-ribosyltransferase n=1 Tax=Chromera velia CCMP2878 TaxID=1169474 RepID=A0A0G4H2K1_9ALVE|eukprot:Cvel_24441.t1-p1 / transcript=Cvel_24441.t1 / gene=Cvel_24441 / organism=Chromera_velia_CCMP2878 / gene_product=hypothetical protein / transcript_product=hypothetical protein / location=Cvel_scaffold2641:14201-21282(+) / protein_length=257 / sequence_SO=supercontig / SO=protein_coding / is_pseudo=false
MAVSIDHAWANKLRGLLQTTPLPKSLSDAVKTLDKAKVDVRLLQEQISEKAEEWKSSGILFKCVEEGGFGLPNTFHVDFAVAIWLYTLEDPGVCFPVNKAMRLGSRHQEECEKIISEELQAFMPYIKFLDTALESLPPHYRHKGEVRRGVKWVFPSPDDHRPETFFAKGTTFMSYGFRSASKEAEVMMRDEFCGAGDSAGEEEEADEGDTEMKTRGHRSKKSRVSESGGEKASDSNSEDDGSSSGLSDVVEVSEDKE